MLLLAVTNAHGCAANDNAHEEEKCEAFTLENVDRTHVGFYQHFQAAVHFPLSSANDKLQQH